MKAILPAATIVLFGALASAITVSAQNNPAMSLVTQQNWESCEEMHDAYVQRFENSPGFGLSRMGRPLMMDRSGVLDLGRTRYSIETIELIGLLQPDSPVVYVPEAHAMRPMTDGRNRDLTDFEKRSLAAFRAGKGIASETRDTGKMQCIGSLRAKDTCLRCHTGRKSGDLLGAFTYRLSERKPGL